MDTTNLFMGFCYRYCSVAKEHLSLRLFTNHVLLWRWMALIKARGAVAQSIVNHVSHVKRVLVYLAAEDTYAQGDPAKVGACGCVCVCV
jgi:hypothetical protein